MNVNPEFASFWKGRILFEITCESTEKPLAKSVMCKRKTIEDA